MPTLDQHCDQPTLTETIAGTTYKFSHVTAETAGKLQNWAREHVKNPLDVLKGHLDGFSPAEKSELLRAAQADAEHWPPDPHTTTGFNKLLQFEEGQIALLGAALERHHSNANASQVYRAWEAAIERDVRKAARGRKNGDATQAAAAIYQKGQDQLRRIVATAFGHEWARDEEPDDAAPKA